MRLIITGKRLASWFGIFAGILVLQPIMVHIVADWETHWILIAGWVAYGLFFALIADPLRKWGLPK